VEDEVHKDEGSSVNLSFLAAASLRLQEELAEILNSVSVFVVT